MTPLFREPLRNDFVVGRIIFSFASPSPASHMPAALRLRSFILKCLGVGRVSETFRSRSSYTPPSVGPSAPSRPHVTHHFVFFDSPSMGPPKCQCGKARTELLPTNGLLDTWTEYEGARWTWHTPRQASDDLEIFCPAAGVRRTVMRRRCGAPAQKNKALFPHCFLEWRGLLEKS